MNLVWSTVNMLPCFAMRQFADSVYICGSTNTNTHHMHTISVFECNKAVHMHTTLTTSHSVTCCSANQHTPSCTHVPDWANQWVYTPTVMTSETYTSSNLLAKPHCIFVLSIWMHRGLLVFIIAERLLSDVAWDKVNKVMNTQLHLTCFDQYESYQIEQQRS